MAKVIFLLICLWVWYPCVVFAEQACFIQIYLRVSPKGMESDCDATPSAGGTDANGCTNTFISGDNCVAGYKKCCDVIETVKQYVPGGFVKTTLSNINVGDFVEATTAAFDDLKDTVIPPGCLEGFVPTGGGGAYSYAPDPHPAQSGELGKVDADIYIMAEQDCKRAGFSNNTSLYTYSGLTSGVGGSGGTVTVDMTATNDLLTAIKVAIEASGGKGDNTGFLDAINSKGQGTIDAVNDKGQGTIDAVNNIKALLEIGGAANPNALLQSIKGILDGLGTKGTEGNQLLTDIKTILQNGTGSTGGGTGGTATDMTATNNLLTESKGILGSIKDKIDSLYESVTGFFNTGGDSGSVDALSTAGVPTEGDLTGGDLETRMRSQLKEKFEFEGKKTALDIYKEHQTEWGKSDLFGFINNLNVQMGASLPVWNLSLPRWGVNYTFDLGDSHWSYIFGVVRTLIIIGATIMAYRIIFRAGA